MFVPGQEAVNFAQTCICESTKAFVRCLVELFAEPDTWFHIIETKSLVILVRA